VVGIATSGRTPYVIGALEYARTQGAATIGLSCNRDSRLEHAAELMIVPVVGPEIISGSTRMKAGTATKMVLNMFTTGAMVLLGKTYGNLMVDLKATNRKLTDRTRRIVATLTGASDDEVLRLLGEASGELKTAVVMHQQGIDSTQARERLMQSNGQLRPHLRVARQPSSGRTAAKILIGVDGGGSKTHACVASWKEGKAEILGKGTAGPSNPNSVGWIMATENIRHSIALAYEAAGVANQVADVACIGLAGSQRADVRQRLIDDLTRGGLAERIDITHDADPVLYAASDAGCGIALIVGTGSICFGRDAHGTTARSGGWGYLIGDEGSGYAIGLAAARAVARDADGRGSPTAITSRVLESCGIKEPAGLIPRLYGPDAMSRQDLAQLAKLVIESAETTDSIAQEIVAQAAAELAAMIAAVSRSLATKAFETTLALAGGLLTEARPLQQALSAELNRRGLQFAETKIIYEPVLGAIRLCARYVAPSC
jgi:N-acetylglucosamine kinase-like BadF-type ATPase